MMAARLGLSVFGSLLLLIGFIWIGQGLGNYPTDSTVVFDQTVWIGRGAAALLAGAVLLWFGRRPPRRGR